MTQTSDDPRPVPPLGWCAECIREGVWLRAATLWQGTSLCAHHLIYAEGIGDVEPIDDSEPRPTSGELLDRLRRTLHRPTRGTGF